MGGDIPERWWELFRSRPLDRLIAEGLAYNADLEAAEAAVRVAYANARAERGALLPALEGSFTPTRQKVASGAETSNAASGANIYSLHTAQLSVSYVLDLFGGVRRGIEAAGAAAEAQEFQREVVYLTLVANIAMAAIQEASLRGQIAATQRIISLQDNLLKTLRRQYDAGQIAQPDVAAQETAVAQARLLLSPLEKQLFQQRHLLSVLTGRFPSEDVGAVFSIKSFALPRNLPVSLPADLLLQRPDVRAAMANVHQASAEVGVAMANRLPKISLTANLGSSALAMSQLFSPYTGLWTIAGDIAQPIFNAGALANKQVAAEETLLQATAQYRGVVLNAFQNVADALRALQVDRQTVAVAAAAERAAARGFELAQRQVERGQTSVQALITAQQAFLQTSIARVQAEAQLLSDVVMLFQAVGGGWWKRPEAIVVTEVAAQ
jgi:NodT family efflux transporter outer membrane factor (OMF) lipoprotein